MADQTKFIDPIEKDDLTSAMQKIENLEYLMDNINEEYFHKYDRNNDDHRFAIVFNFLLQGHLFDIACEILKSAIKEFHEHDIWCFEKEEVAQ